MRCLHFPRHSGHRAAMNPESRESGFDALHRPGRTARQFSVPQAEFPESAPNARLSRRDCRRDARACPTGAALQPIVQAAIPWPAGLAPGQNHRRSSGRHCRACSRRSPRRMCTRRSRFALPSSSAAGLCHNIRSLVGVAAPWSYRLVRFSRIIANRIRKANDEFPSIRVMS